MKEFELDCPVGQEVYPDRIRMAAAEVLRLRGNAIINVIDPTKSYQSVYPNADADCVISRRSIDARGDIVYRYRIEAYSDPYGRYHKYELPEYKDVKDEDSVIVIGAGPAGMFAALKLLTLGLKPIILERGKDVHARKFDMAKLSKDGIVNPESNYCYGEGGAGAFSDGKLFTRSSKRGDIREVLYQFVNFGANPDILIDAHPHIGSDRLPKIVENIRECILSHGGEYHFESRVTDIVRLDDGTFEVKVPSGNAAEDPTVTAAVSALEVAEEALSKLEGSTDATALKAAKSAVTKAKSAKTKALNQAAKKDFVTYSAKKVILATGHSARDIYELFAAKKWELQPKGFAMGVRVEHQQSLINDIRYHGEYQPGYPAAEYSFVQQVDGRGVFSFCMCPGGVLVPSSTEPGTVVLNGMSNASRTSKWANAGVVVSIEPEDVPEEYKKSGAFALMDFQRDVEKKMYDYDADKKTNPMTAPAQRMIDFCNGVKSEDLPETSYHPGVVSAPLHELLPEMIVSRLQKVFPDVRATRMRGYFTNDALLLGVESRTSSPIRIPRDPQTYEAIDVEGLYPCGEGAGYAGGIVSSALDGINCATAAYHSLQPVEEPVAEEVEQPMDETVTEVPEEMKEMAETTAPSEVEEVSEKAAESPVVEEKPVEKEEPSTDEPAEVEAEENDSEKSEAVAEEEAEPEGPAYIEPAEDAMFCIDKPEREVRLYQKRDDKRGRFGDRGDRSFGDDRGGRFGDRPRRSFRDRDDRPRRDFGEDRPYGDRPSRPYGDRPSRSFGDRDDRPRRDFGGDRPYGDRPSRPYGDRPSRSFGDRDDRPRRDFGGDRPYGDRPSRPYGDRPSRSFGDRDDRPRRDFGGDRPYGDRPSRPYGDRPSRSFGGHDDRGGHFGGDRGGRFGGRPRRDYDDRPREGRNFDRRGGNGSEGGNDSGDQGE
jgi:uncharacterized FAD-dependent dehydrogenase